MVQAESGGTGVKSTVPASSAAQAASGSGSVPPDGPQVRVYSLAGPSSLPSSHTLMASSVAPAFEASGGTVTEAPPGSVTLNSGSVRVSPGASSEEDGGSGSDDPGSAAGSVPSSSSDPQPAATSATTSRSPR